MVKDLSPASMNSPESLGAAEAMGLILPGDESQPGDVVQEFIEFNDSLKGSLNWRERRQDQTTEQVKDVGRLYSRNPYYTLTAYSEAEPDIHAEVVDGQVSGGVRVTDYISRTKHTSTVAIASGEVTPEPIGTPPATVHATNMPGHLLKGGPARRAQIEVDKLAAQNPEPLAVDTAAPAGIEASLSGLGIDELLGLAELYFENSAKRDGGVLSLYDPKNSMSSEFRTVLNALDAAAIKLSVDDENTSLQYIRERISRTVDGYFDNHATKADRIKRDQLLAQSAEPDAPTTVSVGPAVIPSAAPSHSPATNTVKPGAVNVEVLPAEEALVKYRDKLADLSVQLRGKTSKKRNQVLRAEYNAVLGDYKHAYEAINNDGLDELQAEGHDDDTIASVFAWANAVEHSFFIEAEREAYAKQNPKLGKVAEYWARTGLVKRSIIGGIGGSGFTTVGMAVLGGALAATGAGAVGLVVAGLSVKAAKSIGMYKLNGARNTVKQFDKKAGLDEQAVSALENFGGNVSGMSSAASNIMMNILSGRVEKDQKENRRRLMIAVGGVAVGAGIGSLMHDLTHGVGGRSHNSVSKPTATTTKPTVTPTTEVQHPTTVTTAVPRPTTPTTVRPAVTPTTTVHTSPTSTIPANNPVPPETTGAPTSTVPPEIAPTQPTAPVVPITPEAPVVPVLTEVPILPITPVVPIETPPQVPNIDISRLSWTVAHEVAPGHEIQEMQGGIDYYNYVHGTHFKLTPHGNSTWIMDGNHAISQPEMEELNGDMLLAA